MSYDNESYLQSLNAARGDIDRNIQNTLNEVNRQRDVALQGTARIPAQVAKVGAGQLSQMASGTADASGHIGRLGLGGIAGIGDALGAAQTQAQGRIQGLNTAYGKAAGLLKQGFNEQAVQRQGQVDQIGKQLYADNDSKRAGYIQQREAEQRQRAFQEEIQRQNMAAQQAAMRHAAALQQQQIAAQQQQANEQRLFQERENMKNWLFEAQKVKGAQKEPELINFLYQGGYAPQGMSLSEFGSWLGVSMPKPSTRATNKGRRIGGAPRI